MLLRKIFYLVFFNGFLYAQTQAIQEFEDTHPTHQTHQWIDSVEIAGAKKIELPILRLQQTAYKPNYTLSAETLQKFQVQNLHDAVKFVPGVYAWATYGGVRNTLGARGYRDISFLREGIPVTMSIQEMQGVEQLHFLTGSNALLFGQVSPGGVYYVETKKPFFNSPKIEVGTQVQMGEIYNVLPFFDINYPIYENLAVRLNASYTHRSGQRNYVEGERYFIQPGISWKATENTQVFVQYEYLKDKQRPDNGAFLLMPDFNHTPTVYMPKKEQYFGFESDRQTTEQQLINAKLEQKINKNLTFSQQIAFAQEEYSYKKTGNNSLMKPILNQKDTIGYEPIFQRSLTQQEDKKQNTYLQTDLILHDLTHHQKFNHRVQLGLDAQYLFEQTQSYKSQKIDEIDILTGFVHGTEQLMSNSDPNITLEKNKLTKTTSLRIGTLAQYQFTYQDQLEILAGARWTGRQIMNQKGEFNNGWTPLAGIYAYPLGRGKNQELQLFFTYTNSFVPSTLRDMDTEKLLGNDYHQQFELGMQWSLGRKVKLNLTTYHIQVADQIVQLVSEENQLIAGYGTRAGGLKNQGAEIGLEAEPIKNLNFLAGYSFTDSRYVKSDKFVDGSMPFNVPQHTFYLWADYTFTQYIPGFSLGVGGNFVGERYADDQAKVAYHNIPVGMPRLIHPAYFQLDARVGYVYKKWGVDLKGNNLTNAKGLVSYRSQYVNYIDPTNVILTMRYKL